MCPQREKFISPISYFSKHICLFTCAYKCSFVHAHISIHKRKIFSSFCAQTCLLSMWFILKHKMAYRIKGNKSRSAQEKAKDIKKGAINPTVQNWKRMVGMERCLPVGRVGEDGSSIRALDRKKRAKKHKEENNQYCTFLPFKTEKNGNDGKMFTRRARRRRRIVNRSPR